MKTVKVELQRPHKNQQRVIDKARRFNVLVCGRRFGKTALLVNRLARPALAGKPVGWFAPNEKHFTEVWREFIRRLQPVIRHSNSQEKRIELVTGGVLDFWTLHNTDDPGRSRKYAMVAVDEAAVIPDERFRVQWQEAIRPTLTDYAGSAWFASTPKGNGYFRELFERDDDDWRSFQLPTTANPFIDAGEVEAARLELPSAVFRQEYLAEFVTDFGAVFKPPAYYDPNELPRDGYREATGCDFAYTSKAGDWTVFITGRLHEGIIYVTDLYRAQTPATEWAVELKSKPNPFAFIGGQEAGITDFLRKDYGIRIETQRAVTDKLARAQTTAAAWNRGEIRLPDGAPITTEIEAEVLAFTGDPKVDATDDVVDALTGLREQLSSSFAFAVPDGF